MNPYKPQFMGSIAPFDDPEAMSDFLKNKFEAFSIIFDCIKGQAHNIESVTPVNNPEPGSTTLSIAITTTGDTLEIIKQQITNGTVFGNIITATT